ncbi:MAG: DUF559 domain-containing protein [Planctomycetaceae bacterium]
MSGTGARAGWHEPFSEVSLHDALTSGVAIGLGVTDVPGCVLQLVDSLAFHPASGARRVVSCELDHLPSHQQLLEILTQQLCATAGLLWPNWYEVLFAGNSNDLDQRFVCRLNELRLSEANLRVHREWFRQATSHCAQGRTPWCPQIPLTVQVRQLSECLKAEALSIIVGLRDLNAGETQLHSLARAVEWLASEAQAEVILIVPGPVSRSAALSSVRFLTSWEPSEVEDVSPESRTPDREKAPIPSNRMREERRQLVQPIIGRPHPGSPGEQALSEALEKDEELRGLFEFNLRLKTIRGNSFLVDLIWKAGRVVVEVDGYYHHSSPLAFSRDRNRDYELLISGFVVLRLTHEEVMDDVALAIEKIRDVVRFRRKQSEV